ncbi:MAG: phospholipase D-like domain-containing protein [Bacteroidota bacterium]
MLIRRIQLLLLIITLVWGSMGSLLFSQASITAIKIPNSIADGGGTGTTGYPFAVYVRISGWTADANGTAYLKLYNSTNNEYMWSATGVWSNTTTYSTSNQPVVSIDAGGNWSGWIYAKHNTSISGTFNLRAAKVGGTSTNLTQTGLAFTALTMTSVGNGGWIVRSSSPAVNKGIAAYSGGVVVGTYRTEDNGITEGYSYSSGGFKIAVPTGSVDSLVSYNDDASRDQLFIGPWSITAGQETDASTSSQLGKGSASIIPTLAAGTVSQTVTVSVHCEAPDTLRNSNVIVPSTWSWSHTTGDIVLTGGGSALAAVSGDTIKISAMTVTGADSIQIAINNITPPDSTDYFSFPIQTGTSPDSIFAIGLIPKILVHGSPRPVAEIKINDANGVPLLINKYVTTRGIVTVATQFGGPGYIQDNSAGIAIYDSAITNHITIGDEIIVLGVISPYSGLCELANGVLIQTLSTGNPVNPLVVTASQIKNDGAGGVENYEGLLVRVNTAVVTDTSNNSIANWTVTGSGTNYRLTDASGYADIRVSKNVDFANLPAPQGSFDVIGVVSQYKTTSPYIGGYQLMPRFSADILSSGPIFATAPVESNLTPTSFTVKWTTVNNGTTRLRYGTTTTYEMGILAPDNLQGQSHSVDIFGLQPATIYHVQAFSVDNSSDTSSAGDLVVSTTSPAMTTGQINVYFNKSVDTTVACGEKALANQDLVSRILNRINNAHYSIDAALYSFSGSAQGDMIANAMVTARNRGVKIRVICEHTNYGGSGFAILRANGITMIDNTFDPVWNGQGLMHNKFFIFDYRGGTPDSIWVWGGSWNPTNSGTLADRQNSIEIQDVALAGAYTTEFNVMWGSNTDNPNSATSRFGARKPDVVPHNFIINGIPFSVYFSPSDHTTLHINSVLGFAQHSISSCIYTFTRSDIANVHIAKKTAGDKVRVVMDNNTDTGNQYAYLQSNGIDVHLKGFSGALLHHKYAVVDGDQLSGNSYLITGSHNWSNAAETSNDENELIAKNSRLANLYLQEFTARYYEAGGTDSIHAANAPLFSASKSAINFDSTASGATKKDSFVVSNYGNQPLHISSIAVTNPRFTIDSSSATIAPSASQKFVVTFAPIAVGQQAGYIVLQHDAAGSPDSISVQGKGVGSPIFSSNHAAINFDTVAIFQSKPDSFTVTNAGNVTLKVTSVVSSNPLFIVAPDSATLAPADSQKFIVTFTPIVPGQQNGYIALSHNGLSLHDTVRVAGAGKYPSTTTAPISMLNGWNMISLPVKVSDGRRSVVFPNSTSSAFAYEGGYKQKDTLTLGEGYWIKSPSGIDTVTGATVTSDSIPVKQRWNMVGSITHPVLASSVTTAPGSFQSAFYEYNGGYNAADTIQPGKAYWVKVSLAGNLYLSSSFAAPKKSFGGIPEGLNHLEITDAEGRRQTLYFGEKQAGDVSTSLYELPPTPPAEAFDVRFGSDNLVAFHEKKVSQTIDLPIHVQAAKFPVTLRWKVAETKLYTYSLTASGNAQKMPFQLKGQGQTSIDTKLSSPMTLTVTPVNPLPEKFALLQNYPNPFNPVSTITYELPVDSRVVLKVYDVLGREVGTLLNNSDQAAGVYQALFDGSNYTSGLYFYRLEAASVNNPATTFSQMKKMLLVK